MCVSVLHTICLVFCSSSPPDKHPHHYTIINVIETLNTILRSNDFSVFYLHHHHHHCEHRRRWHCYYYCYRSKLSKSTKMLRHGKIKISLCYVFNIYLILLNRKEYISTSIAYTYMSVRACLRECVLKSSHSYISFSFVYLITSYRQSTRAQIVLHNLKHIPYPI